MYYSEELMKRAGNIAREHLVSFGTCFGKFTKTGKYRLHITALDYLAPYAKVCIFKFTDTDARFFPFRTLKTVRKQVKVTRVFCRFYENLVSKSMRKKSECH